MKLTKYNKENLFNYIDRISIVKTDENQVITKFDNRVISISNVSSRYEVFDIVKYLKEKIVAIESNFDISEYYLSIKGGRQYLQLVSDTITINGIKFNKSFYICNSTDKSRKLSFNAGLHSDNFYIIGSNNVSLVKKHLKGVTQAAEDASVGLSGETFDEQIKSIESLVGHRIQFSKLRQVILGEKEDVPQINHRKFDALKNAIRWNNSDHKLNLTKSQIDMLYTPSERLSVITDDFYLDAFWAFGQYMKIFNKQDSHVIKKETERIMKITQWAVRNNVLEALGI